MARFIIVLVVAAVVAVQAGGQLGHAAPATAEVFWRTVLPHSPLPDSILRLLRPAADGSFVSKPEQRPPFDYQDYKRSSSSDDHSSERAGGEQRPPFDYQDYKRSSSSDDHSSERAGGEQRPPFDYQDYKRSSSSDDHSSERAGGEQRPPFDYQDYRRSSSSDDHSSERAGAAAAAGGFDCDDYRGAETRRASVTIAADTPFGYAYNKQAPSTDQAGERHTAAADTPFAYKYKAPSTATGGGKAKPTKSTVFFHEESVRVGERLPFHFPPASPAALGLLPGRVADSVPFTTPSLPGALAAFGVAPGSAMASSMEATLRACQTPTIPGESKFCATSLEALVERAMGVLGTRDVRPVTSTLPRAGAPLQTYTVRAVRRVEGGPVFVACHDEPYPYTVYRCHTTGPSRAYMVEMEGPRGGSAVSIATVCHTDTTMWNPEHVSFKLLGTRPGGAPVCHLMPYGHIIWAKNVKLSTA